MYVYSEDKISLFSNCNRAACAVHMLNICEIGSPQVHNVCKLYMLLCNDEYNILNNV